MYRIFMISVLAISVCFFGLALFAEGASTGKSGGELFKENCAVCHPNGGNIINPQKPLQKKEREANGVKNAKDIVGKMRNPGPGMTKFDEKMISDSDAKKIAEYILKTFK
jgi:cytochrome c6